MNRTLFRSYQHLKKTEVGQTYHHLIDKSTTPKSYKNDFISPVIIMHMNVHYKSHTAVTKVTDKAQGPVVIRKSIINSFILDLKIDTKYVWGISV